MGRKADKLGELSNCDVSQTLKDADSEGCRVGGNVPDHLRSKEGSARLSGNPGAEVTG